MDLLATNPIRKRLFINIVVLIGLITPVLNCFARVELPLQSCVSWLTIAAERLPRGGRIAIDIYVLNAPGAIALYVPAVWLKDGLAISTKLGAIIWTTTAVFLVSGLVWRLLSGFFGPSCWIVPTLAMPFTSPGL